MPRQSERQKLLQTLKSAKLDLQLAQYFDLVQAALHMIDRSDSDSASDSDSDNMLPSQSPVTSMSSISSNIITDLESLLATSEGTPYLTLGQTFLEFESLITALHDGVEKSCYLADRSWTRPPRAPQLQLLEEWSLEGDIPRFCRKLRVVPEVFAGIIQHIEGHPVFLNASNNPQLPVPIQLAIFLNAAGHYGNVSTTEDLAEWAGVSIGTVYNCFHRVMIAILQHHDDTIHFDPMEARDQEEIRCAKVWVENKGCFDWRNGFLCMDGSPFNLFQKPGWHGEGFYDRKSRYSLSSQVNIVCYHRVAVSPQLLGCHHATQSSDCRLRDQGTRESS